MADLRHVQRIRITLLRWITLAFALVPVIFVSACFSHLVVVRGPELMYDLHKPSTRVDCSRIHEGMDFSEVQQAINWRAEPYEQKLTANRFEFWRHDTSCVVEIDPTTKLVSKAYTAESPLHEWDMSQ